MELQKMQDGQSNLKGKEQSWRHNPLIFLTTLQSCCHQNSVALA